MRSLLILMRWDYNNGASCVDVCVVTGKWSINSWSEDAVIALSIKAVSCASERAWRRSPISLEFGCPEPLEPAEQHGKEHA